MALKVRASLVANIYWNYGRNARRRGLAFELSKEEFAAMIFRPCYICGNEPLNTKTCSRTKNYVRYNGIDRIQNEIGYVQGNVETCCWKCNTMKGKFELSELKAHITKMMTGLRGLEA